MHPSASHKKRGANSIPYSGQGKPFAFQTDAVKGDIELQLPGLVTSSETKRPEGLSTIEAEVHIIE